MPEYPYQDPDYEVPNQPDHGDPEVLPKGTILRPSAERMPFSRSGELLPEGAELPVDFSLAPDIKKFPWTRNRGQEWTDAAFRAEILSYISTFFAGHSWARRWAIVERKSGANLSITKYPDPVLVFRFIEGDGTEHEVAQAFPRAERTGAALATRLAQVTASFEALVP